MLCGIKTVKEIVKKEKKRKKENIKLTEVTDYLSLVRIPCLHVDVNSKS